MRSFDDVAKTSGNKQIEIPDVKGAKTGLTGVKAPFGYRQQGDIEDRLRAAGVLKPAAPQMKR